MQHEEKDDFITYFKENDNLVDQSNIDKTDKKYKNYLIVTRLLKEIRFLDELNTKESIYLLIDEFVKNDKSYEINTLLKKFFDDFKVFFDYLYHDICYSEYGYINSSVYGDAFYSIDKDFILNNRYKNEYQECAGMYDALAELVPSEYVDLVFEDFLYTICSNIGFEYHRKRTEDNIYYQVSYSSRIKSLISNYLKVLLSEFGDRDISKEPEVRDYIKDKLINKNEYVKKEKVKHLKRY